MSPMNVWRAFLEMLGRWVAREHPASGFTPTGIPGVLPTGIVAPRRCFNCTEELPEGFAWKYCDKCVLAVEEARVMYAAISREGQA